ncbi:MAG: NTPase [Euryarchaeota archaeon]|nr:NTPase [Euryarchaeota archaeon]
MTKNVLITGRPGVGKTTLVKRLVERLGVRPRGFYTEEIRVGGEREGFMVRTFGGREGTLAHVDIRSAYRVGKYGVDLKAFEEIALPELEEAVGGMELLVVDEIGKMELLSERFRSLMARALESPTPLLGVVKEAGDGFVQAIKGRRDVKLFTLTLQNRDALLEEILTYLRPEMA